MPPRSYSKAGAAGIGGGFGASPDGWATPVAHSSQPIARGRPRAGRAGVGGGGMAEPRGGRQLRRRKRAQAAAAATGRQAPAPPPWPTARGRATRLQRTGRRHSYAGHSYAGRQRGREAPLGYKPYSGAVSNEYVRMGNLKPDLNTEELTTKRANLARVRPQRMGPPTSPGPLPLHPPPIRRPLTPLANR